MDVPDPTFPLLFELPELFRCKQLSLLLAASQILTDSGQAQWRFLEGVLRSGTKAKCYRQSTLVPHML